VVLAAVQQWGGALGYASESLKADKDVVLAAVQQWGRALEFAPESLKANHEVVLAAVQLDGRALEYAAEELKDNKDVVLAAVQRSSVALGYASESLKANHEFMLAAVQQDGRALEFAADSLKTNHEVVLAAVQQNGDALKYAAESLKADPDFKLIAVQQDDSCEVMLPPPKAPPTIIDVEEASRQRVRAQPQRFKPRASFDPTKRKLPSSPAHEGPHIKIKHEDPARGLIRCPSCSSALNIGTNGCHLQVCTRTDHPGGSWFYFCFHCREELPGGRHCNKCPHDNNRETRQLVKVRKNIAARRNPIELD